jgi:ankyrin repeat protein
MKDFFEAINNDNVKAIDKYLEKANEINLNQPYEGKTALHLCCELGRDEILEKLINHGIDINAKTQDKYNLTS